jgi:hypothetical protein
MQLCTAALPAVLKVLIIQPTVLYRLPSSCVPVVAWVHRVEPGVVTGSDVMCRVYVPGAPDWV